MYVWDEIAVREAVPNRSSGICEACAAARASEMHHRRSRGVGGLWTPANILHVCHRCHAWITNHPADSYRMGLSVRSHDDPEAIPVHRFTGEALFLSNNISPPLEKRPRKKRGRR